MVALVFPSKNARLMITGLGNEKRRLNGRGAKSIFETEVAKRGMERNDTSSRGMNVGTVSHFNRCINGVVNTKAAGGGRDHMLFCPRVNDERVSLLQLWRRPL